MSRSCKKQMYPDIPVYNDLSDLSRYQETKPCVTVDQCLTDPHSRTQRNDEVFNTEYLVQIAEGV